MRDEVGGGSSLPVVRGRGTSVTQSGGRERSFRPVCPPKCGPSEPRVPPHWDVHSRHRGLPSRYIRNAPQGLAPAPRRRGAGAPPEGTGWFFVDRTGLPRAGVRRAHGRVSQHVDQGKPMDRNARNAMIVEHLPLVGYIVSDVRARATHLDRDDLAAVGSLALVAAAEAFDRISACPSARTPAPGSPVPSPTTCALPTGPPVAPGSGSARPSRRRRPCPPDSVVPSACRRSPTRWASTARPPPTPCPTRAARSARSTRPCTTSSRPTSAARRGPARSREAPVPARRRRRAARPDAVRGRERLLR